MSYVTRRFWVQSLPHTERMHWRLMSTLSRVLVVTTGAALVAVIVLLAIGRSNSYLIFAALALVIASIFIHRRDMNRAIARQLQRDADEAAARHDHSDHPDTREKK